MGNVTCTQEGVLAIKCKNCDYVWNTPVVINQVVDDTCPNCGTDTQEYLVVRTKGQAIDIPEFMSKPKEVVTYELSELQSLCKLHYDLGKQKGLSNGITIGLIILGIVLFLLFAPFSMLPM